ncbi:allene oxide synthase 3-like [Papaver somniferum]|uniref:allene oxide synthase 3-like n=1 Tax=Papaver somniferum TaxID=3469 RepID=UPI000E6F6A35|nr:allene oxide synthase 3-like [Papaver somniferum]
MASSSDDQSLNLPLKEIPGNHGLPIIGPILDRYNYNYFQGHDEFIKSRMEKYKSSVFRMNMLPGQFIKVSDPKVIVLADALSFPILFDLSKVEKSNVLDGTFMPCLSFTGGCRTCAYLDPSEEKHSKLKSLFLSLIASRHDKFIPESQRCFKALFDGLEADVAEKGAANFNTLNDNMAFDLVFRVFFDINPADTMLGNKGPSMITKWLVLQLHPLITLGLPKIMSIVEDFFLHTFSYPSFLVKSDYQKIYEVIYTSSTSILDEAETLGLSKEEACHNLVFLAGFNAYGGMKALFPALMKWLCLGGQKLHKDLAEEIRTVIESEGGVLTLRSIEKMTLTKSVVYEALRIEPPVPYQYARAKEDLVINSHDACYKVKKGELLFGYQPFATKDPKIFENPEEFIGTRFIGEGEKLLKYVYWSNERETVNPTVDNKQCPAKNIVVLLARLMVIEFFQRYKTCTAEISKFLLGSLVNVKTLTKH